MLHSEIHLDIILCRRGECDEVGVRISTILSCLFLAIGLRGWVKIDEFLFAKLGRPWFAEGRLR